MCRHITKWGYFWHWTYDYWDNLGLWKQINMKPLHHGKQILRDYHTKQGDISQWWLLLVATALIASSL